MSLVPYYPSESSDRQVVLRHNDFLVLRDPTTQQLDIRRHTPPPPHLTECPLCRQTILSSSRSPPLTNSGISQDGNTDQGGASRDRRGSFVSPEYFALLQQRNRDAEDGGRRRDENEEETFLERENPVLIGRQSPIRRLTQPVIERVVRALTTRKEDGQDENAEKDDDKLIYTYPTYSDESDSYGSVESSKNNTRPASREKNHLDDEESPTRPGVVERESSDKAGIKRKAFSNNYFENFFITEKQLGSGGKGVVLLVRHQLDGVDLGRFACKRVPVGDDHAWLEKVLIEVQLLQKLSHPNLVSYRHVWLENVKISTFGPRVPCAFILQEYCDAGDLLRYVVGDKGEDMKTSEKLKAAMRRKSRGARESERPDLRGGAAANGRASPSATGGRKLPFEEIYSFFRDITAGLAHLHAANYIHRDLKPSNVLMQRLPVEESPTGNAHLRCLISDFGEVQAISAARAATGATGTISYCAPEVLLPPRAGTGGDDLAFGNFTAKSDVFSLGMVLYFMCFGRLPYVSAGKDIIEEFEDVDGLREEISGWDGYERKKERDDLPEQVYALLRKLLARDPDERPTAQDILKAIEREDTSGEKSPIIASIETGERPSNRYLALKDETPSSSDAETVTNRPQHVRKQSVTDDSLSARRGKKSPPMSHLQSTSPRPSVTIHQEPQSPLPHAHPGIKEKDTAAPMQGLSRALSPVRAALLMPPPAPHHPISYLLLHPTHAISLLPPRQVFLLSLSTRLALLLIRVYSLATICLPWGMNPWILGVLVAAMFLEWSYGARGRARRAGLACVGHFVVLWGVRRGGWLCEGGYGARSDFWG